MADGLRIFAVGFTGVFLSLTLIMGAVVLMGKVSRFFTQREKAAEKSS
ncbi:MAG: OadG family protein [Deltaproteobacteria bacterium]|nr:OadG family protein [Deltaproteobacteria bacterium]